MRSLTLYFDKYVQHVRRAAVLALSIAGHNKPNLIKGLLAELLPLLYDQTVVKVIVIFIFDHSTLVVIERKWRQLCYSVVQDKSFFGSVRCDGGNMSASCQGQWDC